MKNQHFYRWVTTIVLLLIVISAFARVGGGGGDSSGGDGDGGEIFEMIILILLYIPFPYNLLILAGVLILLWLGSKGYRQSSSLNTISKVNSGFESETQIQVQLASIPSFNKESFMKKADFAFLQVQKAWTEKKLGLVRRFLSDGVYQRFNVQQLMMEKLGQTNQITKLNLYQMKIAWVENEGMTDIIHVQMAAQIQDHFKSEKFPKLNQSFKEEFIEFWTFVRRRGREERDIYFSQNCPNCMAPLPEDMGDVCKCPACNSFTNVGEYDWVLSEITQPEEFIDLFNHKQQRKNLKHQVRQTLPNIPTASVQVLEDKASNAFLQYKVAYALKDFARIRRFSHDNFFEKISSTNHETFLYNRLYLRDVSMVNIYTDDEKYYAVFSMGCREQKVKISPDEKLTIIDAAMVTAHAHVVLCLSKDHELSQYPVFAHNCSNCGAGVMDSLNIQCSFCGSQLNSDKRDWILYDVILGKDYGSFRNTINQAKAMYSEKKEAKMQEEDFAIRDYVLNNAMVMMMADGVLEDVEREYMVKLSKKLGYNSKKVSELWEHSSINSLALMMPDDQKSQQKVYNKMKKAAMADGNLHENEKMILEQIKTSYQLNDN